MPDDDAAVLNAIDAKLTAILTLMVDQYLRETELAKPRPRTIDRMLDDAGLTPVQIGRILGKSRQAVSQVLARDAKPAKPATAAVVKGGRGRKAGADPDAAAGPAAGQGAGPDGGAPGADA